MKNPVSILQELSMKRKEIPRYELVFSGGTSSDPIFRYSLIVGGVSVTGEGRSKKDAKLCAAVAALNALAKDGIEHPDFKNQPGPSLPNDGNETNILVNYIVILKDYCSNYNLPPPAYELVSESGPPHLREFIMSCAVGSCVREGTGNSKQAARRQASNKVLDFLGENLTYTISEIEDDQALSVMGDIAAKKYAEACPDTIPWRPNLGQKIADYHNGLNEFLGAEKVDLALKYLKGPEHSLDPLSKLDKLLEIMELEYSWIPIPAKNGGNLMFLNIPKCDPPITISGVDSSINGKSDTAVEALEYFSDMLQ